MPADGPAPAGAASPNVTPGIRRTKALFFMTSPFAGRSAPPPRFGLRLASRNAPASLLATIAMDGSGRVKGLERARRDRTGADRPSGRQESRAEHKEGRRWAPPAVVVMMPLPVGRNTDWGQASIRSHRGLGHPESARYGRCPAGRADRERLARLVVSGPGRGHAVDQRPHLCRSPRLRVSLIGSGTRCGSGQSAGG